MGSAMSNHPPLDDWGGNGPVLHLAHANGFPPATYRRLIEVLKSRYRVVSLRTRCLVPGSEPGQLRDWEELADELVRGLRAHGLEGVVGVGHSVGGVCTLLGSVASPGLFRSVVALEPVLFTGGRLWAIRAAKLLGLTGKIPPATLARRRRAHWNSREEAAASYRKKALFRGWDAECFQDYLTHGLTEAPGGGFQLAISTAWEARIYETWPPGVWRRLRSVSVPTLVLRGSDSDTLTPAALEHLRRTLPGVHTEELPGGTHLFPMERPEVCGQRVLDFLTRLETPAAAGG
jgi:pimeloyl-ACP methyl ester carboxylesterase